MADLSDLFSDIQGNRAGYLKAATGKQFEERIAHTLDRLGYLRLLATDLPNLPAVKILAKRKDHADLTTNRTEYRRHYLLQPFGKQDYPDFLVFSGANIIGIEAKYSQGNQRKPMWNSGLPRLNGIYVFGAYKAADVTFFRGGDVVSAGEVRALHQFFADQKTAQDNFNANEMTAQRYGFSAYIRKAFEQNRRHNDKAIIDFFTNPYRPALEAGVINYVKRKENQ